MITFGKAFQTIMGTAITLDSEAVPLQNSLGRVLAQDVVSDINMPPFNKSAMDGYACRKEDLKNKV